MRSGVLLAAAAMLAVLVETTLAEAMPWKTGAPDILLVLCVFLGFHRHSVGGALAAFFLGYIEDSVSGVAAGLNAFGMCVVFLLVYLTSRRLWVDNILSRIVVVFIASLVKTAAVMLLVAVFLTTEVLGAELLRAVVAQAAFAAAVAPPVFALLVRARRFESAANG